MSEYVMQLVEFVGIPGPMHDDVPPGAFLRSYDPDAHDGHGAAVWTRDMSLALVFATPSEALACYQQRSTVKPTRDNGGANKPLTAATVAIIRCDPL